MVLCGNASRTNVSKHTYYIAEAGSFGALSAFLYLDMSLFFFGWFGFPEQCSFMQNMYSAGKLCIPEDDQKEAGDAGLCKHWTYCPQHVSPWTEALKKLIAGTS